MTKVAHFIA